MKTATPHTTDSILSSLNLTMEASAPRPEVRDKDWPCIAYDVCILRNGREIWSGPYHLGTGHVDYRGATAKHSWNLSPAERTALKTLQSKPYATLQNKELAASLAAKLAVIQKVTPKLTDVLHSLLMDGSPDIDGETFEDWCSNFGYDSDSRKAENMYKECCETGRKLRRAFSIEEIASLRDAFQDY